MKLSGGGGGGGGDQRLRPPPVMKAQTLGAPPSRQQDKVFYVCVPIILIVQLAYFLMAP